MQPKQTMPAAPRMSLFDVAAEYRAQVEALYDIDLDEQTLADTLEALSGDLEVKANNTAIVVKNLEALADAMDREIRRMDERRKATQARAMSLRRYILQAMDLAGVKRIESPWFRLRTQNNPQSVDVFDEAQVPSEYRKTPPPPPPEVSKTLIRAAIESGVDVPGARLIQTRRLVIE
jgi:hypothetical protein